MTEMVTSGSMSGEGKRSDGLLGESDHERRRLLQAPPVLYATALLLDSTGRGKQADVTFLDDLIIEPGAIYIMDRGYLDFARLHRFTEDAAFFVTRTKKGIQFRRRTSHPVDFATG